MARAKEEAEEVLRQEYTVEYSSQDFVRAVVMAFGALAPAAIRNLDEGAASPPTRPAHPSRPPASGG